MSRTLERGRLLPAALCFLSLATPLEAQQELAVQEPPPGTELVYVDSQELLQRAPGATQAQQTWSQELARYRTELQQMRAELDSMQTAYQQQESMLSETARERRRQEIVETQQELQRRAAELEQRASQRQQELLNPILVDVREVIAALREERGYRMVFDAAAAGLLAADPALDITDLVLERLEARRATDVEGGGGGAAGRDTTGGGR